MTIPDLINRLKHVPIAWIVVVFLLLILYRNEIKRDPHMLVLMEYVDCVEHSKTQTGVLRCLVDKGTIK